MDLENELKIVYYIYLNPKSNWQGIISGQLIQLRSYGILAAADLYVHITDCYHLKNQVTEIILKIAPKAILSFNYENQFEYPAIKLLYDLALKYPDQNFAYFHTKGMSYNIQSRLPKEIILLTKTFENWKINIKLLNKNGIQKVGLFPAIWLEQFAKKGRAGGWIWYNFYYATGKYLSNCRPPELTPDRHYYEGWLGMNNNKGAVISNDCMSLNRIQFVTKNYYTATEAEYYLYLLESTPEIFNKRINLLKGTFIIHCRLQYKKFRRLLRNKH